MLVSRDLVWTARMLHLEIVCRFGRGCQREVITVPVNGERL